MCIRDRCSDSGGKAALDCRMGHENMAPNAHHRTARQSALMPREQPAKDRRFPAWTQRGTTARLGAAGRHAGNHGGAAHQQIMHRVIQRIYFSAQRGKGGIGGRGRGGFIVHA
jgi:hypothetical protein